MRQRCHGRYWGSTTNTRFTGSGEVVRHIFKMGNIEGGEWRDPRFLRSIDGALFRGLSQKCCATLLFPPMEWDFPVENPNKVPRSLRPFLLLPPSSILLSCPSLLSLSVSPLWGMFCVWWGVVASAR